MRVALSKIRRRPSDESLPARLALGIASGERPLLIVLSGRDQTAAEFRIAAAARGGLRAVLERTSPTVVEVADVTFSSAKWRDQITSITLDWLEALHRSTAAGCAIEERG